MLWILSTELFESPSPLIREEVLPAISRACSCILLPPDDVLLLQSSHHVADAVSITSPPDFLLESELLHEVLVCHQCRHSLIGTELCSTLWSKRVDVLPSKLNKTTLNNSSRSLLWLLTS